MQAINKIAKLNYSFSEIGARGDCDCGGEEVRND